MEIKIEPHEEPTNAASLEVGTVFVTMCDCTMLIVNEARTDTKRVMYFDNDNEYLISELDIEKLKVRQILGKLSVQF